MIVKNGFTYSAYCVPGIGSLVISLKTWASLKSGDFGFVIDNASSVRCVTIKWKPKLSTFHPIEFLTSEISLCFPPGEFDRKMLDKFRLSTKIKENITNEMTIRKVLNL